MSATAPSWHRFSTTGAPPPDEFSPPHVGGLAASAKGPGFGGAFGGGAPRAGESVEAAVDGSYV